eukprot:NODE_28613_length_471_cov_22.002907.p5 GENE.NODE_28613_length_471_cov_22.002907~~NODE_28613_length_471_cov_22.002907.p5  ORF type:complete len:63 (+),score=29.21 NODE_28613_length_471_cov_22.002907:262-450(+)
MMLCSPPQMPEPLKVQVAPKQVAPKTSCSKKKKKKKKKKKNRGETVSYKKHKTQQKKRIKKI